MKFVKNAIYNIGYQMFSILFPLVTVPYISRVLGSEGVGKFSYTNVYAQYFILVGMLGISFYGNRQVAYIKNDKEKLKKEFWNIYLLQFISTTIAFIIYLIIFILINTRDRSIYLAQGIFVLANIFDISWFFMGYEELKSVVIKNFFVKILGLILIFLLVKKQEDLLIYTIILSGTVLLGQIIMWLSLVGKIKYEKPTIKEMRKHFIPTFNLFVSQLAIQVYVLLDRTMLGLMADKSQVGFYDNSQKIIKLIVTLVTSIGVVMLPKMSSLYSNGDKKTFNDLIYKSFSFVNLLGIPMFFGLVAIADGFTPWFYGAKFIGIERLIKAGALIIIAISWSNILGIQIMLPIKKEREFSISVFIGAIVNFMLNLFLIHYFESFGTTIASVIAEFAVTVTQFYFLKDVVNIRKVFKTIINPSIASIIMFVIIKCISVYLTSSILNTCLEIIIGSIVYFIILILKKDEFLIYIISILKQFRKV